MNQNLIFIGMSNAGKSHWSKLLSQYLNMPCIEFDDLIGQSSDMAALLKNYPGRDNAEKLGHYFGMPWSEGFAAKEEKFLEIEAALMRKHVTTRGAILDLTGSAIYCTDELKTLSETGLVVYLQTSPDSQAVMLRNFIANPKPVCWRGVFKPAPGESNESCLERCYPILLSTRSRLYEEFAHIVVPEQIHKNAPDVSSLLDFIQKKV